MIGNDVVDLGDPETMPGAQHGRFDARVFSPREQRAVAESFEPTRERWLRWASKEAAYKCLRARDTGVRFSPVEIEIERRGGSAAIARWRDRFLPIRLEIGERYVHAIASDDVGSSGDLLLESVQQVAQIEPSAAVRRLAVAELTVELGAVPGDLKIERNYDRVPIVLHRNRPVDASLSLSHHGRFVAFACDVGLGARCST